jgi:hypothetical protein
MGLNGRGHVGVGDGKIEGGYGGGGIATMFLENGLLPQPDTRCLVALKIIGPKGKLDKWRNEYQTSLHDERLVLDLLRGRGRLIGGDLNIGEEGFEQMIKTWQSLHHGITPTFCIINFCVKLEVH